MEIILVNGSELFEQTVVLPTPEGYIWKFNSSGLFASVQKMLKNKYERRMSIYFKLTYQPSYRSVSFLWNSLNNSQGVNVCKLNVCKHW